MHRWFDGFHTATSLLSSLLITTIVVLMSADVTLRVFFQGGLRGIIEISEILLVIAVYAAMGIAQKEGRHVAIGAVTTRFSPGVQRQLRRSALLVTAVFLGWTIWVTWNLGLDSLQAGETRFGVLGVAVWPARLAIPVGMAWLLVEVVREFINPEEGRPEPTRMTGL